MCLMLILKYVFVFWLKNPMAFEDEFWLLFAKRWIRVYSILAQIIADIFPGKRVFFVYVCSNTKPEFGDLSISRFATSSGLNILLLVLFSVIGVKLHLHNSKTNNVFEHQTKRFLHKSANIQFADLSINYIMAMFWFVEVILIR